MKKAAPEITYNELVELVSYNKLTGLLTWKVNRSRLAMAGDEAGCVNHHGTVMVGVQGRTYPASRLIWLYVTGAFPRGRLILKDGDQLNLRWNNLAEERVNLSHKHTAVYQRRRRRLLRLAMARINADASLQRAYVAPKNANERDILKRIAAEIEDEMHRNGQDPGFR